MEALREALEKTKNAMNALMSNLADGNEDLWQKCHVIQIEARKALALCDEKGPK